MNKHFPLLFILLTIVIALYAPRSPAQIQPAAIQDLQPPQLLTPENGSIVKGAPEFFWTSAVLPKGFRGSYRLKVVPVLQGQTPSTALAENKILHQATMRRTGEAYPADGPAMQNGQTYAWCVQVVDANGAPVGGAQGLSDVFVFVFGEDEISPPAQGLNITTQPLVMTGMRVGSLMIDTQPLVMTGMRVSSITVNTGPLVMTGMRVQSITINTQPLVMTGMRVSSITVDTQPLVMTGIRVGSITVNTDALIMTGMRTEQPKPPVVSDKVPIKAKIPDEVKKKLELPDRKSETDDGGTDSSRPPEVKEPKQKLDLPSKDTGTIDGTKPPVGQTDGAQMRQRGAGELPGEPAGAQLPGETPSLTTPAVPENPAPGTAKQTLLQKAGAKKTAGDAVQPGRTVPVDPPAGTP